MCGFSCSAGVRSHSVRRRCGKNVRESGVHQRRRVRPRLRSERWGQAKAVFRRDNRLPLGGHRQVQRNPSHRCHTQHVGHATRRRPLPVDAKVKGAYPAEDFGADFFFFICRLRTNDGKLTENESKTLSLIRNLRRQCIGFKPLVGKKRIMIFI